MDFLIFTAHSIWGKAGTIEVDGVVFDPSDGYGNTDVIPKGTHAIRWKDPIAWFWAKDGKAVATLPSKESPSLDDYWQSFGGSLYPFPYYTFKGAPLGDGSASPFFEFPLAGDYSPLAPPAELADTLVMQVVEPGDVEYLGKEGQPPAPVPLPPPPFDDFLSGWDPCAVPEFCEPEPVPGGKGLVCKRLGFFELCDRKEETAVGLVRVKDLSAAVGRHLRAARALAGAGDRGVEHADARAALHAARERAACAQLFGRSLDHARSALVDILRRDARTPHCVRFAVRASLDVELGLRALGRCAAQIDAALRGGAEIPLRDAALAHRHFGAALIHVQRLDAWALAAEARNRSVAQVPA
ncbi:hypothetical protein [Sorangium sp. So ce1335]|uniref:hypothetical protein n=1 Tax=Sorangium sp. So ce1335 TaxID=3133335 RepID=UPI003F61A81E